MKIIIIGLCMALLLSCTSQPLNVRYYLLHTPEKELSHTTKLSKEIVVLQPINVADYLRQASLVMQVGEHELYYSRQDVWAEKLQSSFHDALLQDLNKTAQRQYVATTSPKEKQATLSVRVKLEHFHATDESTVLSSGHYWLSEKNTQTDKNEAINTPIHSFFFETELKQDGYAHAVDQLRTLISQLAQQIEKDIAALPNT